MIHAFAHPLLLIPAAVLALASLIFGLVAHLRPGLGVRVVGQRPLLQGFGMALLVGGLGVGLAEPRWGLPEAPRLTVQVLLDASRSMRAQDVGGKSRFEAATGMLDRLWREPRPGIRFGLSLLTGDEIPMMPAGEDRTLLRESLAAVQPGNVGSPGSSFGRVIPQVASQVDLESPTVLLLISDGEETWEAEEPAITRAITLLKEKKLPLFAVSVGGVEAVPVPLLAGESAAPGEPLRSKPNPALLTRIAEGSGGRMLKPEEVAATLQQLASGHLPMPARRSLQPVHPEAGAWLALLGLALWLAAAGKPLTRWRPVFILLLMLGAPQLRAQPLPQSVKAWLAQRALERGDLPKAQHWIPNGRRPDHALLAAAIWLQSGQPEDALKALESLTGQGAPRPLPEWRPRALLLAARAHLEAKRPDQAKAVLERLLLESPNQQEALHDLQSLVKDPSPPPPPDPKKPPPPPPPRPSQGAQQDELEGIKQRLPKPPPPPPGGVKDL